MHKVEHGLTVVTDFGRSEGLFDSMNIENQGGGGLATETMTITVSRQFATNVRELSALFGYGDGETGKALEAIAGWWLQALRDDDGELIATAESHLWRSEAACRAFAGRLQQKMPEVKVNVYEGPRGWSVEIMPPGMIVQDLR
jgi:hypothetical protein